MRKDLYQLRNNVYDAINLYINHGRHALLKENYQKIYEEYTIAGGKYPLKHFEDTIDHYNIQGQCGY